MAVFFTADTHFGHAGILHACKRPFASIQEHDSLLIEAWNATVAPGDTVYHLGDFALGPAEAAEKVFRRLNGRKCLIAGNHDRRNRKLAWAEQHEGIREVSVEGKHLVLCHYPMRSWPRAFRGSLHLYGHTHGKLPGTTQSCDVGVDVWGYRPVSLAAVVDAMALSDTVPEELRASA
ncbi:metallophosphoesterase family protein [Methylobacterium sp. PvR107]|uniref:metallophosphoesterase family protein n=1 Tax=Methylobacterium sp. PvR107 TaxID=2806597 RepID=UPI001AE5DC6A|nr:metallophosphoesterase family protein [Methylobacterium sp. PvR107]MBP1182967.1 calcineurin-like phosphoesterase family protein [Methylobacterium sp. PvR107]